jgi:eukaryotic-like serine/threonine-protein kinase
MNTDRSSHSSDSVPLEGEDPHPICAQCGTAIPCYVGSGICPACLLSMGRTPGAQTSSGDGPVTERWTTLFPELDFETCLSSDPDREVYLATHAEHGDLVRLSFVRGRQLRDSGGAQAWQRCAHALAQLNHPRLAKLLDFGEKGDSFFLLTRIPDGESLEETLAGQDKNGLAGVMERVLETLNSVVASAQGVGVTLRVNPSLIILSPDGQVTLLPEIMLGQEDNESATGDGERRSAQAESIPGEGSKIGPYTLLARIGEGGFGDVYLAEQEEPIRRRVALKIIKQGMDTRRVLARFEAERQALALLNHPYIARVLDAGATDQGRPYFVMELVDGLPITRHCAEKQSSIEERLRLMMAVCQAVRHAHQKGLIHRDLKPSNVLITEAEGSALPKVIDFGIAKVVDQSLSEHTVFTREFQVMGTPEYMSPEQLGGSASVDSRSDVYSLGALLYELLTGTTPVAPEALADQRGGARSAARFLTENDIPKPSARLAETGNEAPVHNISRELDWITLEALEHDPELRYQSPDQLGEDLRRFLDNEAVEAGPPTRAYQLQKFVRRHRAAVGGAAVAAVALLLGMGLALAGWLKAEEEKQRAVASEEAAQQEAEISEAINAFLRNDLLGRANPYVSGEEREVTLREAVDRAAAKVDERFADKPEVLASLHYTLADTYKGLSRYQEAEHHARRMVAVAEKHYGAEHLTTIAANSLLARILAESSQFEEALTLHQEVLALKQVVMGEEHASTLRTRTRIAKIQGDLGNREEAEQEFRDVLEIQERVLEKDHEDTLSTLESLAQFLFDQRSLDKREEALKLARERLARSEQKWGPDHLITDSAENTLAVMLDQSGQPGEAEPLHRRVLERRRAIFGEKHDATLTSMDNLASALKNLGRLDEALTIYRESVPLEKELFGVRNMTTLAAMHNFGLTLHAVGKHAEALSQLQEVLTVGSELLGENHPNMLATQMFLGDCHYQLGNVDEAIRNYQHVVPASREVMGATHPEVILRGSNLAWYLGEAGRHVEAEPVWQAVCAAAEEAFADQPARLAKHLSNYGWCLREQKKFAESMPILKRVETIYHDTLGADDLRTKEARLDWLTSKKQAGEPITAEDEREFWELRRELLEAEKAAEDPADGSAETES